jgi:DNA-binding transcriptional MerR regulator
MRELSRRAGVPRETIHFYLREGLLPPPRRKSRNMAHYGEEHLARIEAIRSLREERGLPLGVIRRLLDREAPATSEADLGVLERILSMAPFEPDEERAARRTGLRRDVLAKARALGLVSETLGPGDARVLEAIAQAAGADVLDYTLEDMAVCARHLERMVEDEARHFFRSLLRDEVPARTLEALQGGRGAVARFLSAYRGKLLHRLVEETIAGIGRAVRDAGQGALPPLGAAARRAGRYAERARTLGGRDLLRLHLGAGEVDALEALAREGLVQKPGDPLLLTMLGAARVDAGRTPAAVEPLEAAAFAAADWALPRAWLGVAVLGSLGTPGSSVVSDGRRGIRLLDAALRGKREPSEARWIDWLAGGAFTRLPEILGRRAQGGALLAALAASRPRRTDLEGVRLREGARRMLARYPSRS